MIDETKEAENKISAVLYCPRYYDSIQKLIATLNKDFEKK